jgi:membrane dipeptidase
MKNTPLIVDAHEDLAWNMAFLKRDYTRTVAEIRQSERGNPVIEKLGDSLLGWDAYQQGKVALVFSTLFAAPERAAEGEWDVHGYANDEEAHQAYRRQVDMYHQLVEKHPDKFSLIRSKPDLNAHMHLWRQEAGNKPPVGLVILMEGADGVRQPAEVELWWQLGVRVIGPAWKSTKYCGGTGEPGPLTKEGFALLEAMSPLGYILDVSHMDEEAVLQCLDSYPGRIVATHANVKSLLPGTESNRFLSERVIQGLIERQGVIGVIPFNRFLDTEWKDGDPRERVTLDVVVRHIDVICQAAGNARHAAIGSDFDGGFGLQSAPAGIDSVADLQKLSPLLEEKGYSQADIAAIFGENWLDLISETLPDRV